MSSAVLEVLGNDDFARKRISKLSAYQDPQWIFDAYNPASSLDERRINWARRIGNGVRLTDPAYTHLLWVCKRFSYHLLLGYRREPALKSKTVLRHAKNLLNIVVWMINARITRFSDLDQPRVQMLREYLRVRRGPGRSGLYRNRNAAEVNTHTLHMKFEPLLLLRDMKDEVGDVPTWDPSNDPGYKKPGSSNGDGASLPIPMDIAVPLFSEALRWITEYSEIIIEGQQRWDQTWAAKVASGLGVAMASVHALRALRSVRGSIRVAAHDVEFESITKRRFTTLRVRLETACLIVVAGFSGMRSSELASIPVDCIECFETSDGRRLLSIASKLIKTAPAIAENERWIAGFDEPDNPIRLAVATLSRLGASDRLASNIDCLFIGQGRKSGIRASTLTSVVQKRRLNDFLASVLPSVEWILTPHQLRKTFARFVARNSSTAILALRRHFKHVSVLMTEQYTGRFDFELYKEVVAERELDMREALDEILGSRFLAGKLGEVILERNESFRGSAGADAREKWISSWMANGDVPIMLHPYGICFMFRDRAKCGLDSDSIGLGTCLGCKNLIVTKRHYDFWTERLTALDRFEAGLTQLGVWSAARAAVIQDQRIIARRFLSLIHETDGPRQP